MEKMTDDRALEITHLHYRAGETNILNGISFTVRPGWYTAIIGPNGAGKTTLMKCINRILHHWHGDIEIYGHSLRHFSQKELAKMLSYVPQVQETTFAFTVREFLLMSRFPYLSPFTPASREDHEAVAAALATTGMSDFSSRTLGTLSSGERQKVYIAAALAQDTPMLLLDEPVTFLDPRYQAQVNHLLQELHTKHDRTIVTVSHDINAALRYADAILALKGGEVVFHGPPAELTAQGMLQKVFDTAFTFVQHPHSGTPVVMPEP